MKRTPSNKRISKEQEEIVKKGAKKENLLSTFLWNGMELMMQELLEEEATEFLQRGHYERKNDNPEGILDWE